MAQPINRPVPVAGGGHSQVSGLNMGWLLAAFLCIVVFALDFAGVESGRLAPSDRSAELAIHATFGHPTYHFFEVVTALGATSWRLPLAILLGIGLFLLGRWWSLTLLASVVAGASLLQVMVKDLVMRPRPVLFPHAISAGGYSFPSGHAMDALALYGVAVYLLWHLGRRRGLTALGLVVASAVVLLVGLSRIVLGVHYPTDVVGGFGLSGAWLTLMILLLRGRVSHENRLL